MKTTFKLLAFLLVTSAIAVSCGSGSEADAVGQEQEVAELVGGEFAIDAAASSITWNGTHVVGDDDHSGTLNLSEGTLSVQDGKITGGNFTIDMTSIAVTDEMPEDKKANLIGHLAQSGDFFNVTKYPTAKFEITKVEGDAVSGNLTMLDSTHNVTFNTIVSIEDGKLTARTEDFTFDRTLWGITFMSTSIEGMVKEKALSDDITISINLTANTAGEAASDEAAAPAE